ncbi:MAG: sulfotransferase domain-containing protein, partial [Pseudomonadota bacterium]
PKEPNYFSTDLPQLNEADSIEQYLSFFDFNGDVSQVGGEASTWYLYSKTAASNILEFQPDARMIVMLRNPVDMFFSLHAQFKYNMSETIDDPREAWNARTSRPEDSLLQYGRACALGAQVSRLLEIAPRQQLHFIFFDDLSNDPKAEYLKALQFLGLPIVVPDSFAVLNERKTHRSKIMERFLRSTPTPVAHVVAAIKKATGIKRLGISNALLNLNTKRVSRPPQDPGFRAELRAAFEDDIRLLAQRLDTRVLVWLQD